MARRIDRPALCVPSIFTFAPTLAAGFAALAALGGCEQRIGQPSAPPPQPSQTVVEGAGSAPGKALESGHKLEDKVSDHNKAIEKQIEDINKN